MKLFLSTLLAGAAFVMATPASADSYGTSQADYRAYCQNEAYYERYESYCSRFDRDDDSDYDDDDAYDDEQDGVRNSNYNHNRTYLRGYSLSDDDSADIEYGDRDDEYDDDSD